MFEQSMLNGTAKTRRAWTVMVSFLIQTVVIGIGVLIPLIAFDKLPQARLVAPLMAPPPPPPAAGPKEFLKKHSVQIVDVKWQYQAGHLVEPGPVPVGTPRIVDPPDLAPDSAAACLYCVVGSPGALNGRPGGVLNSIGVAPPVEQRQNPVVTRAATKPAEKPPIRIIQGGMVVQAKLIHKVTPAYPPLARQAHVSGTVRLQAVISRDGRIQSLALMSGHALLVPAALEAVRQWVYSPTLLNYEPVEVLTTIDVIFTLSQ